MNFIQLSALVGK